MLFVASGIMEGLADAMGEVEISGRVSELLAQLDRAKSSAIDRHMGIKIFFTMIRLLAAIVFQQRAKQSRQCFEKFTPPALNLRKMAL